MTIDLYLFDLPLYTFGVVLGTAAALLIAAHWAWHTRLPLDRFWPVAAGVALAGLIGARLYHVVLHPEYYGENPEQLLNFAQGGLGWRGGLLAGLMALWLGAHLARLSFFKLADAAALALPLALTLGWAGAHTSGLYYGAPDAGPLAQELPDAFGLYDLRFPVQLAAAAGFALLFALLLWRARRDGLDPTRDGRLAGLFLLSSPALLFGLSFFRGEPLAAWNGLAVDRWVDLGTAGLGLTLLLARRRPLVRPVRARPVF